MKKTITTLTIISLVLLSTLLFFVGCSDMMKKMGSISLTINLDTPEVTVASYTLEGALSNTRNSFTVNNVTPPKHTLSSLQKGNWNLTVTAFDESNNQIGVGTKTVVLEEGQVTDTTLLVVFGQNTPQLSTFTISAPDRYDVAQGTITGTTTSMEYKLASASEETAYTSCTAPITLLAPGIYKIRYAEAHGLEASEDLTFTIPAYQKVQLSISDPTLTTTKAYDGTAELSGSVKAGTLTNVINGDDVIVHAEASYDSPAVGNDKTITITYSLSGTDALNYIKPANTTKTGIIEKKQLTISGTSVECDKVYNGLSEAHLNIVGDLDGIIGSEVVSANATAAYYDKNVGTGKQVTVTYSLTGENKGNYLPPVTNTSFTGEITRKALSVSYTTPPQSSKVYDGTNTAQIASDGTLDGVIDGDSVILQATATYTDENVGTDKQCMISYTLSGTDADNYSAPTRDSSYTGDITQRELTVTVGDYSKTYGEENPIFTVYVTGFVTGENESLIGYSAPTASCSAEASTGVGTYDITISGGSASNYSFNTDDRGELTINKATMSGTVYISSTSGTYSTVPYGQVLTAETNLTNAGTPTYQWTRDGEPLSWATGPTYTLVRGDIDKKIRVTVTAGGSNSQGSITSYYKLVNKASGPAFDGSTISAYIPSLPDNQKIINLTGFTPNQVGIEAVYSFDGFFMSNEVIKPLEIDSRGRAVILTNTLVTTSGTVKLRYSETETTYTGLLTDVPITAEPLKIGDYYAGGIVAYFYADGDPGYIEGELHGLIASKADLVPRGIVWSYNTSRVVGTETELGKGLSNTNKIISALSIVESSDFYAAWAARSYTDGIYTDWFLPSLEELRKIRTNRDVIGNFGNQASISQMPYWTSSESTQSGLIPDTYAHVLEFYNIYNIGPIVHDKNSTVVDIRPVRYF